MEEYSPIEAFKRAYQHWWLVALCVFGGGVLGWGFHLFQPPVYEAKAVIVVQVDVTQAGNLTELQQDQAMNAVMALFISPPLLQKVQEDARAQSIPLGGIANGQNFNLERRRSNLQLKVRDRDPRLAARLVNLWAEDAYQALSSASQHALRARQIQQMLAPYAGCPTPVPGKAESCPLPTPVDPRLVPTLEANLNRELAAGSGILPAMIFSTPQNASVPDRPAALGVEYLTLAGGLVGFVIGGAVASFKPRK